MDYATCKYTGKLRIVARTYYGKIPVYVCQHLNMFKRWKDCKTFDCWKYDKYPAQFSNLEEAKKWILGNTAMKEEVVCTFKSKKEYEDSIKTI